MAQIVSRAAKNKPKPTFEAHEREMQIVAANNTTPFELPDDWIVQVIPRGPHSSIPFDKYYFEPGTGRKFRSLVSVRRHLSGEQDPPPRKRSSNCLQVFTPDKLEDEAHYSKSLPEGWIVNDVPRKCGKIKRDRYYLHPVTRQRFRSIPEVHRFLEGQRYNSKRKASTLHTQCTAPRSSLQRKNPSIKAFKNTMTDLMSPPEKINWVFSGDGSDNWSPLVEECVLPNYVTEQWSETFLVSLNNASKQRVPQLTIEESNLE